MQTIVRMRALIILAAFIAVTMPIQRAEAQSPQTVTPQPLSQQETALLDGQQSQTAQELVVGDEVVHIVHDNNDSGDVALAIILIFFVLIALAAAAAP